MIKAITFDFWNTLYLDFGQTVITGEAAPVKNESRNFGERVF
jgi:FMN phosphatase YigB (HAD superfamily)